jgi:uncharacterized protein YbjT (DUF2867 family)
MSGLVAVTGANGYLGRHVARRLLASGQGVLNLTGHPDRPHELTPEAMVRTEALAWESSARLAYALHGAEALVNTFWVRFEHGETTFAAAVENSARLLSAARTAGVERVVHVSIANASVVSDLPYFRGKGLVEERVRESGLEWAIVRPTLLYGGRDVLINNIAWALRRLPAFGIPGDGGYPVQPVFVDDLAARIVELLDAPNGTQVDAGGPERHAFVDLVRLIRWAVGSRAALVHLAPALTLAGAWAIGAAKRDVLLTREELDGLMAGLLVAEGPPVGRTSLTQWLVHHATQVGVEYASELDRHYRPAA